MKPLRTRPYLKFASLAIGPFAAVYWWGRPNLAGKDMHDLALLAQETKTVCAGRCLIDFPASADISIDRGCVSGFDLATSRNESDADFWKRLDAVDAGIAATRARDGRPTLESAEPLSYGCAEGKLWVYNRQRTSIPKGTNKIEVEDVSARSDVRFPAMSLTASAGGAPPSAAKRLEHFLEQIRPFSNGEAPTQPGFCIENAIALDPYEHRNTESVVLSAFLPGYPDVSLVFSSTSGTTPARGLLEPKAKTAANEPPSMRLAFTTLREGRRAINDIQGEEFILRVREPKLTTGYSFQWESRGRPMDIHAPLLTLELDAGVNPVAGGKPLQASLSEDALFALWERVARSIRIRPKQEIPVPATKPASIPSRKTAAAPG